MECHLHTQAEHHQKNQNKVMLVVAITFIMMVVEVFTGWVYGSMALLADGIHMGTHFFALSITLVAYYVARKNARNLKFTFGTGKIGSLAGFTSAIVLLISAFGMIGESAQRIFNPVDISYSQSIMVAVIGLIVNVASAFILFDDHHHGQNDEDYHHEHHHQDHHGHQHHHDHNLKAAYLHVIADALTSVLAITALIVAKQFGYVWFDPLVGVVGGLVVTKWAIGLLKETGSVLLDYDSSAKMKDKVKSDIENLTNGHFTDFHIWRIDENRRGLIGTLSGADEEAEAKLKQYFKEHPGIQHHTLEFR